MVITISTGCCCDLKFNTLESIHFLEKYPIDGVELLFATPEQLSSFELDEKALSFLKRLEFVSIHMPFESIIYAENQETRQVLTKAVILAKQVNAQYLVFHPNTVKEFNSIKSTSVQSCIENVNKKEAGYKTVEEIKTILEKHSFLGFVLDIAHALGNNINPADFLEFKPKLKAIHASGQWIKKGNLKEHGFLIEGTSEQLDKVKEVLKMKLPKIIEADFYPAKVPLIEKEINLLKQMEYP